MIEVRNISKIFYVPHEVRALVNVSTNVEAGEVIVVIGPSGSGKSTLVHDILFNALHRKPGLPEHSHSCSSGQRWQEDCHLPTGGGGKSGC